MHLESIGGSKWSRTQTRGRRIRSSSPLVPLKYPRVEGLIHVKSVVAQGSHVGEVQKFGEVSASSSTVLVNRQRFKITRSIGNRPHAALKCDVNKNSNQITEICE
ncbi:hypothetical protein TNCV_1148921 [Trichonephila clavipes]|nr:hypothetical protein TNCV_1148921 [Trichonephila clavipes]